MTLQHINRRGDCYFVVQGKTKTGKAKYYCSRKASGELVEKLPDKFEIYEHPETALVSVRRKKPSHLLPNEVEFLREQIREWAGIEHFILDQNGDALLIYLCDRDPDAVDGLFSKLFGTGGSNREWIIGHAHYSPMFRFTLTDVDRRLFSAERWCYRGSIEDWITLSMHSEPLAALARHYLPHLGKETFFDLM